MGERATGDDVYDFMSVLVFFDEQMRLNRNGNGNGGGDGGGGDGGGDVGGMSMPETHLRDIRRQFFKGVRERLFARGEQERAERKDKGNGDGIGDDNDYHGVGGKGSGDGGNGGRGDGYGRGGAALLRRTRVVVDKNLNNLNYVGILRLAMPNARFVYAHKKPLEVSSIKLYFVNYSLHLPIITCLCCQRLTFLFSRCIVLHFIIRLHRLYLQPNHIRKHDQRPLLYLRIALHCIQAARVLYMQPTIYENMHYLSFHATATAPLSCTHICYQTKLTLTHAGGVGSGHAADHIREHALLFV
jgi:hypothetical protein